MESTARELEDGPEPDREPTLRVPHRGSSGRSRRRAGRSASSRRWRSTGATTSTRSTGAIVR